MTNPGRAMPRGDDWIVRQLKSLQDQINWNASARSLAASQIGSGGLSVTDGGSINVDGGGSINVDGTDLAALIADVAGRVMYSAISTTNLILSTASSTTGIVPLTLSFTTDRVRTVLVRFTCDGAGIGGSLNNAEVQAILTLNLKNSAGSVIASSSGYFSFTSASGGAWSLATIMQAEELIPPAFLPADTYTLGATVQLTAFSGTAATFAGATWSAFAQVIS
jgi:hypothetical protein